jgi:hypothetical protein
MRRSMMFGAALAAVTAAGCGPKSTPVTPAPLASEESAKLASALVGSWKWVANEKADGSIETIPDTLESFLAFGEDGAIRYWTKGLVSLEKVGTYQLDGRNVKTTLSSFPALRADSWQPTELRMFYYAQSVVMVLRRS